MLNNHSRILITGGAGYIGSHTAFLLEQEGYEVVILDNLSRGHKDMIQGVIKAPLVVGDINDSELLNNLFEQYNIKAVIHFAAYAYVGESVSDPSEYYRNNVASTLSLIESMRRAGINKMVFSSTCATYGSAQFLPITEEHPQNPVNPYGQSKLMVERILTDFSNAYDFKSVIFRYFNAAGAEPSGLLGENHDPEPHLIPLILQTALGKKSAIKILGTDYDTPDGTCVRDYIHVMDLAWAHLLGLKYLLKENDSKIFNLSNGSGFSVREIIDAAKKITARDIRVQEDERREGDPDTLIGDSSSARRVLNWNPKYTEIEQIIRHAWSWHCKVLERSFAEQTDT
jgi:UDP-glucose 4-epimerase